ncbi:GNAT family N-acetyltransferase [Streptomyces mayonensis]|uniref:GNAT family N-acetyltransferase n=1 Tax=Streptomyces mayonensis TaxID=2750816 RepID=UPI001C1DCF7D|nr:GNAT family N-acetyltransferase [Streptomyces sp. A108]MBU6529997.1 GNAT family N-acetyltransferase [Streptomyces sp. A108]
MSDVTDGVTHLFAHGSAVLAVPAASLAALIAAAGFRSRWSRRHGQAPPPDDTGARPPATGRRARPWGRHRAGGATTTPPGTGARSVPADATGPTGSTGANGGPGLVGAEPDATPDAGASALWRMRTTVRDAPGSLAVLCAALADRRIDILSLQTHPLAEGTVDEFLLRAPAELTGSGLAELVTAAGGTHTWTERADAHDLVDAPTRLLGLAARTALDAAELPLALRQLLGRCTIRSLPATTAGPAADDVPPQGALEDTVLRLRAPEGGVISVERPYLPFTPAEFARARALVELDARLGPRLPRGGDVLTLSEGRAITVRRADTRDVEAAKAMHERCSARTLGMRYHGPVGDADRYLNHLLSPRFGRTLAVQTASGRIVGLGHLLWDGDETEVALLVEDAWQRRGVGAELLGRLVAMAAETGCEHVYAVTRASNTGMVAAMRGLGLPLDYQIEEGTLVVTARLEPAAPAAVPLPHAERVGTD